VPRISLIAVLAAALFAGACTSTSTLSGAPSPTGAGGTTSLDACSLLPRSLVESTLPGAVTQVRELAAADFMNPLPSDGVSCAYVTNGHYGQLTVSTWPMSRSAYEARYVTRDPVNTRSVPNLGEEARFSTFGNLAVYACEWTRSAARHPVRRLQRRPAVGLAGASCPPTTLSCQLGIRPRPAAAGPWRATRPLTRTRDGDVRLQLPACWHPQLRC